MSWNDDSDVERRDSIQSVSCSRQRARLVRQHHAEPVLPQGVTRDQSPGAAMASHDNPPQP